MITDSYGPYDDVTMTLVLHHNAPDEAPPQGRLFPEITNDVPSDPYNRNLQLVPAVTTICNN